MVRLSQVLGRSARQLWQPGTIPIVVKYVLAGGLATGVNFLVRIPLTSVFGFEIALMMSQAIGFTTGFILYRTLVFTEAGTSLVRQIMAFGGVNLLAAGVVIGIALVLHIVLLRMGISPFYAQMIAHASGLAAGAPFNFSGHFLVTFRSRKLA